MSVPGLMMPGQGAPPPPGADGGGVGGPMGGGGPDAILKLLASLQQQPSPDAERKMLQEASLMVNGAYAKVQTRSAKAARLIMDANSKSQAAIEALQSEGQKSVAAPPDLGMGQMGAAAAPGLGMGG